MLSYQHILVVIEPEDTQFKALKRALEIEQKSNAKLTIFASIYSIRENFFFALKGKRQQALIRDTEQKLTAVLLEHKRTDLINSIKICWQRTPDRAIADLILADHYDLVVKACSHKRSAKHLWFSHCDWQLINQCSVPVLLVKDHPWQDYGHIISSLDIADRANSNQDLNKRLFAEGEHFSDSLKATHHIFDCYFEDDYSMALVDHDFYHHSQRQLIKSKHLNAVKAFVNEHIESKQAHDIHIIKGLPEDELPSAANQLDAELIIIGTHGSSGLLPYFVGHTCDHVLEKVACDLLVLKPS